MDRLMAGPFFEKFYADASLLAYHPSNKQKRTKKESYKKKIDKKKKKKRG